ncbi:YcaO-like family protein [Streptomyces sp. NPDC059009]|uniref:YcaO-like family protein n=1 Tax=Streptomyces sp. NPDC059009 TaxID=3346694 RepID=UPI00367B0303
MEVLVRKHEISSPQTRQRLTDEIHGLGWTYDVAMAQPFGFTAARCRLRTVDGVPVPGGAGDGDGLPEVARNEALSAALKHAVTGAASLRGLDVVLPPASEVALSGAGAELAVRIVAQQGDVRLACLPYRALDGGEDLELPLFLWAPWYAAPTPEAAAARALLGDTAAYGPVLSWSVDSGCGIGATEDEALLRALLEWVGRDALSLFLWRSIHERGGMPPRVPRGVMPLHVADEADRISAAIGSRVVVLDLTGDIGIPVALALVPASGAFERSLVPFSVRASLSGALAVEGAVSGLLGAHLLDREYGDDRPRTIAVHKRFARRPRLLDCARIACAGRLYPGSAVRQLVEDPAADASLAEQRREVVRRISAAGIRVLAHRLRRMSHGTTAVQVQCPGLERFHLVTEGRLNTPGARARTRVGTA